MAKESLQFDDLLTWIYSQMCAEPTSPLGNVLHNVLNKQIPHLIFHR